MVSRKLSIAISMVLLGFLATASLVPLSANAAPQPKYLASASGYTVNVAVNATLGDYLVNGTGFTLYYFANDTVGTSTSPPVSACTATLECTITWPVFYAPDVVPASGSGLNASDFTTFTRSDGTNQTAYMGHPLYYYLADTIPGVTRGEGVLSDGGHWYVAQTNGVLGTVSPTPEFPVSAAIPVMLAAVLGVAGLGIRSRRDHA